MERISWTMMPAFHTVLMQVRPETMLFLTVKMNLSWSWEASLRDLVGFLFVKVLFLYKWVGTCLIVKLEKCVAYWSNKKCKEKLVLGGYETMVQTKSGINQFSPIITDTHIEIYLPVLISMRTIHLRTIL